MYDFCIIWSLESGVCLHVYMLNNKEVNYMNTQSSGIYTQQR